MHTTIGYGTETKGYRLHSDVDRERTGQIITFSNDYDVYFKSILTSTSYVLIVYSCNY